jgi:hypothetical protein
MEGVAALINNSSSAMCGVMSDQAYRCAFTLVSLGW